MNLNECFFRATVKSILLNDRNTPKRIIFIIKLFNICTNIMYLPFNHYKLEF